MSKEWITAKLARTLRSNRIPKDFAGFCRLVQIRTKSGGKIDFATSSWFREQRRFEDNRTGRDIVVKPRQIGFSTLELARDLHQAVTREGHAVLIVAHDKDLAEQLFVTIRIMAESLKERGLLPRTRHDNVRELVFADLGSSVRVVEAGATAQSAAKKGRSGTIHRLHCTEMAFWGAAQETMVALMAAVPESGEVVIESTANGAGGLFYDMVTAASDGRGDYRLHFFPWWQHEEYRKAADVGFDATPRDEWETRLVGFGCDAEQVAWWRSKADDPSMGLDKALQEYPIGVETCFRASGRGYLEASDVDRLSTLTRLPLRKQRVVWAGRDLGEALIWEEPMRGVDYVVAGDVAEGVGGDGSSATVGRRDTGDVVATYWSDSIAPGDFGLVLAVLGSRYNTAEVAPERNNHGAATLRALETEAGPGGYPRIYRHIDGRRGWLTNGATRPPLFDDLRRAVAEGAAHTPDAAAVGEARTLIIDKDGRPRARDKGAAGGCRDDRWVSWAIMWQVRSRVTDGPTSFRVRWG